MNKDVFIHKTAIIEEGVKIGQGTKVWDNAHIRKNTSIGKNCIIGGKSYISYDVKIGNLVKINSFVYICAGVTIKDKAMISAGTIFTNDKFPRAAKADSDELLSSDPARGWRETMVGEGATVGAGSVIGCGITLGKYCMVGMGSVVTKDVLPYSLVYGVPAKTKGYVCMCGYPLKLKKKLAFCDYCKNKYTFSKTKHLVKINSNKP